MVDFGGDFLTRSPKMLANSRTYFFRKKSSEPNPAMGLENFSTVDDIYSLALVLYHIVMGQYPFPQFRHNSNLSLFYNHLVVEKQRPNTTAVSHSNAKLITLLSACWHDDETVRPEISNVDTVLREISSELEVKN